MCNSAAHLDAFSALYRLCGFWMYAAAVQKCNTPLQERNVVAVRAGMCFAAFYRKRSVLI
jgi:hypothetical protein